MRRIFTTDAKKDEKPEAPKSASTNNLPDIEVVYSKGVEEIVAGRLNLDVAVADVAKVYNLSAPDVKAEFERRVASAKPSTAPAPTDDVDLAAKKKDRKSTRLNSSHQIISYAVFCLKKKK